MGTKRKRENAVGQQLRLRKARLDDLVGKALVDAYGESEQDDLLLPFETEILGMTVIVEGLDITGDDQLAAMCRKDKAKQRISLSELPLPSPLPKGAEWIVAYRH